MKKMYKYILIITLMMFSFIGEVKANTINQICSYSISNKDNLTKIDIFYNTFDSEYKVKINNGSFKTLTLEKQGDYFMTENVSKLLEKADCPKNLYYKDKYLCIDTDSDNNYCTSNTFESAKLKWDKNFSESDKIDSSNYKMEKTFKTNIIDKTGLNISPKAPFNACVDNSLSGDTNKNDYDYCEALCYYSDKDLKNFAFIYFVKNEALDHEKFKVSFSWSDNLNGQGNMRVLYNDKNPITYAAMSPQAKSDLIVGANGKKQCPLKAYRNDYETAGEGQICFENTERYCTNKKVDILVNGETEDFKVEENKDEIDGLEQELETDVANCEDVKKDITSKFSFNGNLQEICAFENEFNKDNIYYITTSEKQFRFFKYSTENKNYEEITMYSNNNIKYNNLKTCGIISSIRCKDKECFENNDKNASGYTYEQSCRLLGENGDKNTIINDADCVSILGPTLVEEINSYLLYIKIAVPIIIIVLGAIDFGKAFIASDEDKMKKAQKQFIMRLIIGMVIFFIPSILNALLNIANTVWGIFGDTCGITF